jgi:hypothetical protein
MVIFWRFSGGTSCDALSAKPAISCTIDCEIFFT